jgi:WD40 repeat protein
MANEEVEALGARERMALKLHSNNITCCAFWSEEDVVCTGSMDNTLMLWRVRDGWNHRLRAHSGWVLCCAFQPHGAILASGSAGKSAPPHPPTPLPRTRSTHLPHTDTQTQTHTH